MSQISQPLAVAQAIPAVPSPIRPVQKHKISPYVSLLAGSIAGGVEAGTTVGIIDLYEKHKLTLPSIPSNSPKPVYSSKVAAAHAIP